MTSTTSDIYDNYVVYQNKKGIIAEKKSDALLKTIVRPWRSEQGFDFYKYKKEDFAKIEYKDLHFYSEGIRDNVKENQKKNLTIVVIISFIKTLKTTFL